MVKYEIHLPAKMTHSMSVVTRRDLAILLRIPRHNLRQSESHMNLWHALLNGKQILTCSVSKIAKIIHLFLLSDDCSMIENS